MEDPERSSKTNNISTFLLYQHLNTTNAKKIKMEVLLIKHDEA